MTTVINALEHVFEPRGACKSIFHMRDDEVLISGPAGTGKSRACLEKIHMICLITPGVRALIVRKTLASLGSTALVTWRNFVIKEAVQSGDVVYYGGSAQEAPQYRYRNGSTVTIGGMDRPTRVMSSEYDIIYVQEATELIIDDIEALNTRLRNNRIRFQQLLMDCNPDSDKHPLKLRANDGKTKLIESRHEDNPVLFNEDGTLTDRGVDYIGKLDNLTGVRYKRLRLGLWVAAEGQVYEEWDPAIHVLPWYWVNDDGQEMHFEIPWEWPRYWSVDFGFVHPFVCQWWAQMPDGEMLLYREIYMTNRTVARHCKSILDAVTEVKIDTVFTGRNAEDIEVVERRLWTEPQPRAIICDHDAEGRATLEEELGLGTTAAIKTVHDGIDAVQERLKPHRGTGEPRFYIMDDTLVERDQVLVDALRPTCTKDEFASYVWAVKPHGRKKEEPVKEDDDGMDASRYLIGFHDLRGTPRYRELSMD
jgi:hypothetical protein